MQWGLGERKGKTTGYMGELTIWGLLKDEIMKNSKHGIMEAKIFQNCLLTSRTLFICHKNTQDDFSKLLNQDSQRAQKCKSEEKF